MSSNDFAAGKLYQTSSVNDLAISGEGFFAVQANGATLYTRNGQFERDPDNRLVTAEGYALQTVEGQDLIVGASGFSVTPEGLVLAAGEPVGQIALMQVAAPEAMVAVSGGLYSAGDADVSPAVNAQVRQGMLETSNVSMGEEMVVLMEAVRRAEAGQRLINVYDDLMGRVITSFGQS